MPILITNANANINDSTLSYTLTFSGKTGAKVTGQILVNGTVIASATTTGSSSVVVTITASNLYANAQGSLLSGAATFRVNDLSSDDILLGSSSKTGGNITINARNSSLSVSSPAGASPINLDLADPVNVIASWSRPHTAFRGRIKGYVWNGTSYVLVFNRYGYGTSANFDIVSLGYISAFDSAMNGASPRNFRLELLTQFDDGTADNIDIGGVNATVTVTNGVIKTYVTLSTIAISNFELLPIDQTVPFTLNTHGSYAHTVRLKLKKSDGTTVLIQTQSASAGVTNGNFSIGTTERNLILNALPTVTYATVFVEVDTDTYGTTDSQSTATTMTLHADFKPSIGIVSHAESSGTQYVKTALGYGTDTPFYLKAKSKVTFTVPVTNTTGATTSNIRVQFAGTDKTHATSPVTTESLVSFGTLNATITVTDSRGRTVQSIVTSIVVRDYAYPKVDKFEVFRASSSSGDYDPLGTFLRCIVKGTATSVLALNGSTQKNWIKYKIDTRIRNTGSYSNNAAITPGGLSFGELTTTGSSGFSVANAYDVRVRVFDAFYDLDNDASTLEDTDDYAENIQVLPLGEVSLLIGKNYISVGKVWQQGTIDAIGDIFSNGSKTATQIDLNNLTKLKANSDNRSVNTQPNDYNAVLEAKGLKTNSVIGIVGEGTYSGVLGLRQWADSSGGNAHELAFTNNGNIYHRSGATTSWSAWARLLDTTDDARFDKAIEESGSSSGQYWIKFTDGTLIKWGSYIITTAIATTFGNIFVSPTPVQTFTFNTSVPFIDVPSLAGNSIDNTGNTRTSWFLPSLVTATGFSFQLGRATSQASQQWRVGWQAIGRWKT